MKRVAVIAITLILTAIAPRFPAYSFNPNPAADSLKALLAITTSQEEKLELFGKISWAYLATRVDLDSGKAYADSLKLLAERMEYEKWSKRALFYYGAFERFQGAAHEAIQYLNEYVDYFTDRGDSNWAADGLFQMGIVYSQMGDYSKSLETFYRIVEIDRALGNPANVAHSLQSVGNIFFNIGQYDEALEAYSETLSIYDSLGRESPKAATLCNVANVYTRLGKFDEARSHYQESLEIYRKEGIGYGEALNLANIAYLFDAMGTYDSALVYHLKALDIRRELPDKDELARSLLGAGRGYRLAGDRRKAGEYLSAALRQAVEVGSKPIIRDAYLNLSQLHASQSDYRQAYEDLHHHKLMSDSVLNEENSRQINELQTRYETEKKDRQIAILAKETELQEAEVRRQTGIKKAMIIGTGLIALLAGAVVYAIGQRLRNQKALAAKNEELKGAEFKRRLIEVEMKALRAQINPHFLFNCMNSINRMILDGDMDNASRYLTRFSKLVRMILENATANRVSLESELAMLEAYVRLEELRFKDKIRFLISVDDSVDLETPLTPPMILQPFVENAIWHGLLHSERRGEGCIRISVRDERDGLRCTVEDNGVGREKAAALRENSVYQSKSLGVKITEERLRLLNRDRLEELIRFTDLKDESNNASGTRVDILIPVS